MNRDRLQDHDERRSQTPGGGAAAGTPGKHTLTEHLQGPDRLIAHSVGRGGRNDPNDVRAVQTALARHGNSPGRVDGLVGPRTLRAIRAFQTRVISHPDGLIEAGGPTERALSARVLPRPVPRPGQQLPSPEPRPADAPQPSHAEPGAPDEPSASEAPAADPGRREIHAGKLDKWGKQAVARLTELQEQEPGFMPKLERIAENLGTRTEWLINVMMMESHLNPAAKNPSSSASGLIQFMARTAKALGTTTAALRAMSATEQLDWVEKYYLPFKGRLTSQAAVYAAVAAGRVGKSDATVFYRQGSDEYELNKVWDVDQDGEVTQGELGKVSGKFGAGTQFTIDHGGGQGGPAQQQRGEEQDDEQEQPTSGSKPSWISIAEAEIGVQEVEGKQHSNPRILEYHATTGGFSDDETAWCASFVNWVLRRAGIAGTGSAMAMSYARWGTKLQKPAYGSIAVISYGGGKGHVGFVVGRQGNSVLLLGGNQSDGVNVKAFGTSKIVAFVMPPGYEVPAGAYDLAASARKVADGGNLRDTR